MRKKIICMLLCVIMCSTFLAGCGLIVHNDEKDAQQVITVIKSFSDERKIGDENKVFNSKERTIYKYDLISAFNQNGQSLMQEQGMTQNAAIDQLIDNLVLNQLLIIEAERLEFFGDIEWTKKHDSTVTDNVYATIDSTLASIKNEILKEFDDTVSDTTKEEEKKTTFPVKADETTDLDYTYAKIDASGNVVFEKNTDGSFKLDKKGEKIPVYIDWAPAKEDYPCIHGDEDQQSLDRETVLRLVQKFKDLVKDDFKVTKENKAGFKADDERIQKIIEDEGVKGIYPILGETEYVKYLITKNVKQSVQIQLLQEYITDIGDPTNEEVTAAYNQQLKDQRLSYDADSAAYGTDVTGGTVNVLYNKNSDYFYVKHILLPFSTAQTASLTALKATPGVSEPQYLEARNSQYVNELVVYPHLNGENDLTKPMTAFEAMADIEARMSAVKEKDAERKFDELIYKYNTDPGIFEKPMGYAVKTTLNAGEKETYMTEFAVAARKLRSQYNVGQVLPEIVVTDFGVHVMYLANKISAGTVNGLYDPQTPGEYKTYYDIFEEKVLTKNQETKFKAWQEERISYYQNKEGIIEKFTKRYKNLYTKD